MNFTLNVKFHINCFVHPYLRKIIFSGFKLNPQGSNKVYVQVREQSCLGYLFHYNHVNAIICQNIHCVEKFYYSKVNKLSIVQTSPFPTCYLLEWVLEAWNVLDAAAGVDFRNCFLQKIVRNLIYHWKPLVLSPLSRIWL